jgi:hypothetical protein
MTQTTRIIMHCASLGPDELAVLERVAERLVMGRRQYGELHIARDKRSWDEEARQESLDLAVYLAIDLITRRA